MRRLIPALVTFWCLAAGLAARASAQPSTRGVSEDGADLRIYLMTMSPGPIIYERFGHNALVVHDPTPSAARVAERRRFDEDFARRYGGLPRATPPLLPTDRAHHYGAFDFEEPGFVPRFVMGRMEYWTTSEWADLTALLYGADNRAVLLQELALTAPQKLELKNLLEWNERPENRTYRYDYYRDNCSTRVRDAIDRATGGLLKAQLAAAPTGTTYRAHTRRLTSGLDPVDLFWFTGFTYVLGHPGDVPLSAWEEAFLPGKLAEHVRGVTLPGADGRATALVASEQFLSTTTRPPMPDRAPGRRGGYAAAGVVVGGTLLVLALVARRPGRLSLVARLAFALLIVFWSVLWGVGGSIAAWGWAATDHAASYRNENLLQFSPLILPLAVLGPMLVFGRRRGRRVAAALGVTGAALSVLGLLLKVFPAFWQHNAEILALAVPANLGLAAALVLLARRPAPKAAAEPAAGGGAQPATRISPKKRSKAKDPVGSDVKGR